MCKIRISVWTWGYSTKLPGGRELYQIEWPGYFEVDDQLELVLTTDDTDKW